MNEAELHQKIFNEKESWPTFFSDFKYAQSSDLPNFKRKSLVSQFLILKLSKKINELHESVRNGNLHSSKVRLQTSDGRDVEIDFLGTCSLGDFLIELKTKKSAERNSATELNAYSNVLDRNAPLNNTKKNINVLISNFESGISKEAYLFDLIHNERNIIVYNHDIVDSKIILIPYVPNDKDFIAYKQSTLSRHKFEKFSISLPTLPGVSTPQPYAPTDMFAVLEISKICSAFLNGMQSLGLHGYLIGKVVRGEEVGWHYPNNCPYKIYIYLMNPYFRQSGDALKFRGRCQKMIAEECVKHLSKLEYKFTSEIDENLLWWGPVASFSSFGLIADLYHFWLSSKWATVYLDGSDQRNPGYHDMENTSKFLSFLEHVGWD